MDHTGDLRLELRLDRKAVAAVPDGDHAVHQTALILGKSAVQLSAHALVHGLQLPADAVQLRGGCICHHVLGEDTAVHLPFLGRHRIQTAEADFQGVRFRLCVFLGRVGAPGTDLRGTGKKLPDMQQLRDGKDSANLQALQRGGNVSCPAERNIAAHADPGTGVRRFPLRIADLRYVCGRPERNAQLPPRRAGRAVRKHFDDLIIFKGFQGFFIHDSIHLAIPSIP